MKRRFLMICSIIGLLCFLLMPVAHLQTKKAPNFTFADLNGQQHTLASVKGKVAIIDLWATWCGPCKKEIPSFIKLKSQYGDKLQIIGVSYDDDEGDLKTYMNGEGKKINYSVVYGAKMAKHPFGQPDALPTTYFIDKQGNIRKEHSGFMSYEELNALIQKLMAE